MLNSESVLDTEINGSVIGEKTIEATESTSHDENCNYNERPAVSVIENAEVSFPSTEELRTSRTSRSSRNIWPGAADTSPTHDGRSSIDASGSKKKSYRLYACSAVIVLVFLIIVPAVVVSNNRKERDEDDGDTLSAADRPRPIFDDVVEFIVSRGISTEMEVGTSGTPQSDAVLWLLLNDQANVPVPTTSLLTDYDGYRYMVRYVMAVNYFALDGPNWKNDLNFVSDLDVCDWNDKIVLNNYVYSNGLFCINNPTKLDDGTVIIQRLPYSFHLLSQLDGSIPKENGMLTTLLSMQLAASEGLTGTIPIELCSLTNLRGLYLNINGLSGDIPSCLGYISNLEILRLSGNTFDGNIPTDLCQLSKLEIMHLSLNLLDGSIPQCLGDLPALASLDLSHNMLTGPIPSDFVNLEDTLQVLATDDNELSGDPTLVYNQLDRLFHLTGSKNGFSFTVDSTFLENSKSMEYLDLSDNVLAGFFPFHLLTSEYKFLDVLDLSKNELIGNFSEVVTIASSVRYFGAYENNLKGSLTNLMNLTSLIHLDLSKNQLTGSLEPIGGLSDLGNLFLSENPFDAGPIPASFATLRNMQELSLRNTNLNGAIPDSIAENWTYAELIDFGSNNLEGPIPENFGELEYLQYLLLHDNPLINGTVPQAFQNLTRLKGVLLDRTAIDGLGALDVLCVLPNFENVTGTELLVVDCEGDCTECAGCRCCDPTDIDDADCSKPNLGNIDISWIAGFRRPQNEFDFTNDLNASARF